jgi:hypothetical protein
MGVLDDAIREHLELKRLHGASDEEISQEEAEALGPARRDFPAASPPEQSAEVQSAEVQDEEAEPGEKAVAADEALPREPDFVPGGVPEFEPETMPDREDSAPSPPPPAPPDEDTQEHDALAPDEESEDSDDVLEETPEFLQDAPEHDRLWFEQKPPRDFDFE